MSSQEHMDTLAYMCKGYKGLGPQGHKKRAPSLDLGPCAQNSYIYMYVRTYVHMYVCNGYKGLRPQGHKKRAPSLDLDPCAQNYVCMYGFSTTSEYEHVRVRGWMGCKGVRGVRKMFLHPHHLI